MAQKIVTIYTDDLTGKESDEVAAHTFSLDGVSYEIDLAPESYERLLEAVGPYITAGRKSGMSARARQPQRTGESTKIREWAKAHGIDVNSRGRISANVRRQYEAAL
ncbi:Lsr2 family protein [Streptomyces sp. NPDC018019]|uniref:Lsr2 family protein n=1 Tax=Streptomyces sp. NPDC018019 TaxID=3365030 RepID=UPI0037BD44F5